MKRITRLLCLLLTAAVLGPVCLSGMTLSASAVEGETFIYDFTEGLPADQYEQAEGRVSIEKKDGYVTFTALSDDPYFRFTDGNEPKGTANKLRYMVIRYRTTAPIAGGEFFTNRRSGPQWGQDGTHVTFEYNPDGNWHTTIADASAVWGREKDDELYAFRFDPLASGCKAGDSIDVEFIRFFSKRNDAVACAKAFDAASDLEPDAHARFMVDGQVVYTIVYSKGQEIREPVVPERPGYTGSWEPYTLDGKDVEIHAVYVSTQETKPPMPPADMTEPETTAAGTEPSATAAETTAADTEEAATEPTGGCASALPACASGIILMAGMAVLLTGNRRKGWEDQ